MILLRRAGCVECQEFFFVPPFPLPSVTSAFPTMRFPLGGMFIIDCIASGCESPGPRTREQKDPLNGVFVFVGKYSSTISFHFPLRLGGGGNQRRFLRSTDRPRKTGHGIHGLGQRGSLRK